MTSKANELVIIGTGGHARAVIDAAIAAGFQLQGIIDIDYKGREEEILGCPVIGDFSLLNNFDSGKTAVAVAIGDGQKRTDHYHRVQEQGFSTPAVVHPTAIVSTHAKINDGTFVNTGAIINAGAEIGENAIINTGAIIEHEVLVGRHCHVCPGVKIGGRVSIGDNTFVGIGTSVVDYVKIGSNVTIGAGSVIIHDVESYSTVVGTPGKRIK